ncbi:hypothetical protein [Luteimonas abyssi]|uniref:hypothetical protein n=1 Tax=Luteimonas abyssi TaxID=1247514 RepID=UPI000AF9499E|nr:hypothetical protein [Luteimonas abyssi]
MRALSWLLSGLLLSSPVWAGDAPPIQLPPSAPSTDVADTVPAILGEAGVGYEVDDDGDYRIVYGWEREGRSQLVYVSGHTEEIAGRRVREVFSPAARLDEGIEASVLRDLLRDSRSRKLGAWEIAGEMLFYVIKLPEPVDATLLLAALTAAAEIADEREQAFTGDLDAL